MLLSQLSQISFNLQAKHDVTLSIFLPPMSNQNKEFLPLRASIVTVSVSIKQRPREPWSLLHISMAIVSPPPAARCGSTPSLNP